MHRTVQSESRRLGTFGQTKEPTIPAGSDRGPVPQQGQCDSSQSTPKAEICRVFLPQRHFSTGIMRSGPATGSPARQPATQGPCGQSSTRRSPAKLEEARQHLPCRLVVQALGHLIENENVRRVKRARARASRRRSPPERSIPPSPSRVARPLPSCAIRRARTACSSACHNSASVAPGLAMRRFPQSYR